MCQVYVSRRLLVGVCRQWRELWSGKSKMHPVGFEPTHLSIAVLETAPLDRSGTNALLSSLVSLVGSGHVFV